MTNHVSANKCDYRFIFGCTCVAIGNKNYVCACGTHIIYEIYIIKIMCVYMYMRMCCFFIGDSGVRRERYSISRQR